MRALVAGWIGSTNLGDELIFAGLRTHLAALGVEPVALSVNPVATRRLHGVDAVRHRSPADTLRLARLAGAADCLVFGGGGLVQDQTSPWNLPFHGSRVAAARLRRRPWAGIGIGVDPLGAAGLRTARSSLAHPVAFAVRDAPSAQAATAIGLDPVLAADLALALPGPDAARADRIVVSLRPPTRRGLGTAAAKAAAGPDDGWEQQVAQALDALSTRTGLEVAFVALQADRDSPIHGRVASRMTRPATVSSPDLAEVVAGFGAAQLVVTMRYHGAVAALLAHTPAVLIDYSPKMSALADDAGAGFQLIAPEEAADAAALVRAAGTAFAAAGHLPEALAALRGREARNRDVLVRLIEAAQ